MTVIHAFARSVLWGVAIILALYVIGALLLHIAR
jgi:hypothetical protein